jgi:carboxylesterase type B
LEIEEAPAWLEALMLGDTYHEGVIFHLNLLHDDFASIRNTLQEHIHSENDTDYILEQYGITPDLTQQVLLSRVEHMCGDVIFKIPNYTTAASCRRLGSQNALFKYHFDQRSRLNHAFEGTAYHAHELLYLFGNLENEMNDGEREMAREFASAWIRFVNGQEPWTAPSGQWMVWGPDSRGKVMTEDEDESVRSYGRIRNLVAMGGGKTWKRWLMGVDALVNKRKNMGKEQPVD